MYIISPTLTGNKQENATMEILEEEKMEKRHIEKWHLIRKRHRSH